MHAPSNSRASSLHAELPCHDILQMFERLKQRRHVVEVKRQEFLRVERSTHQRLASKRKASYDDEDDDGEVSSPPAVRNRHPLPKSREFSRLFSDNVVPPPKGI
ncbi:Aste57867_18452 [Aphanomyces stellatus]|uniref:Aste57867_18452 protein n=1 Tax=Aphanomyces stellatus TaxID=120398 RepID=A0A485LAQ1_9STRA|nr:hypothetical protein As57867_018390 [Aphanomyces stellatus]VFT95188.1 Aste57867_18452 [Aphanomyces stellatus]